MAKAYHLEIEESGCADCKNGRTYIIIGPDEVGESNLYGDKEEAEYICEMLNDAFEKALVRAYELPLDCEPDFKSEKGTAAHLRTRIKKEIKG